MNIDEIIDNIDSNNLNIAFGRVVNISAVTLTAVGLDVAVGDIVRIESVQKLYTVLGMVTVLNDDMFVIVPFSFIDGFKINDKVFLQRDGLTIKCGNGLLGRVVNALGEPIDDLGKIRDLDTNAPINKESIDLDIKNLSELSNILKNDEKISSWLETCAVAVNDTLVFSKNFELKSGDKISLLPPVCGG